MMLTLAAVVGILAAANDVPLDVLALIIAAVMAAYMGATLAMTLLERRSA